MKKPSEVFRSIRFAKLDPKHEKAGPISTDDEEHGAIGEKEYEQQVKHVKKRAMQEEKKDKYDEGEYDREGDMAKSDLRSIIANAQKLHDMIEDADNLPEWVQSKITVAEDYISTVANYMTAEVNEEIKQIDEISSNLVAKARDAAFAKGKENQAFRFVRKHYEKSKKESDAFGKKMAEEVEQLDEKNVPTNPSLWSRAKAMARSKFDVYPSAYANGWAAKWYKGKGGGWKSVNEQTENPPFEGGTKPKDKAVPGKYGKGYSTARHLARMAMKKQSEKMKKAPMKEETRKAAIVKEIMKKKTEPDDKFQANPTLTSQVQKVDNAVT